MKHVMRTRFGPEIVSEFMPPSRKTRTDRVIILCDGMPAMPAKRAVIEFFAKKGYWVFHPRYRGTWESGGVFMRESPDQDITTVIDHLSKGFTDAWSGTAYVLQNPEIILIGSSFGGATALLASCDPRVSKAIAFSPLVDWTADSKAEPLDFLARFTVQAFGEAYRGDRSTWSKLKKGEFFNPVRCSDDMDGHKLLIVHARDDESILWRPVERFAKKVKAQFWLVTRGGHMGLGAVTEPRFWKRVKKFLTIKS
jgi:pimeloyl-ACP methyl ester carboxylesterase